MLDLSNGELAVNSKFKQGKASTKNDIHLKMQQSATAKMNMIMLTSSQMMSMQDSLWMTQSIL